MRPEGASVAMRETDAERSRKLPFHLARCDIANARYILRVSVVKRTIRLLRDANCSIS